MKITKDEYETLVKMVTKFLEDLEEHGVPSAVVSISVEHEEWGWFASHWNAGDPLACRWLAVGWLVITWMTRTVMTGFLCIVASRMAMAAVLARVSGGDYLLQLTRNSIL